MKRIFSFIALTILGVMALGAQAPYEYERLDTARIYEFDLVEVVTTAASRTAPVAHQDLDREAIISKSYALDLPSALALTPSLVATNETGIGIGATSIRLRGTDATRINVTVNGVAMNNPDSHSVYWYDTPDLISSVGN